MVGKKKKSTEARRELRVFILMCFIGIILISSLFVYVIFMKPPVRNDWGVKSGDWMEYAGGANEYNYTTSEVVDNSTYDNLFYTVVSTTNLGQIQNGSDETNLYMLVGSAPNQGSQISFPENFLEYILLLMLYAVPPPNYLNMDQMIEVLRNWTKPIIGEMFESFVGVEVDFTWVDTLQECNEANESYLGYVQDMLSWNGGLHHLWRVDFKAIVNTSIFHAIYWKDDQTGIVVRGRINLLIDIDGDGQFDFGVNIYGDLVDYGTLTGEFLQFGMWIERYFVWIIVTISSVIVLFAIPILKKHIR